MPGMRPEEDVRPPIFRSTRRNVIEFAMRAYAQRPEVAQTHTAKPVALRRVGSAQPGAVGSVLHWQRTLGNQAVQRHLRARTVNVDGVPPDIQLTSLRDFTGKPRRPAFLIEDDEIGATDEFKKYMNPSLEWQSRDKMTRQEAFLACRLIIEAIQRREPFKWETDARAFMNSARKLFGITKSPKDDCPSSQYKACVKRAELPDGLLGMTALPGLLAGDFTMEVDWHEDEPKCACCCVEYRQFVKGFVKIDGKLQTKKLLNGKELSDKVFTEDSDAQNHPYGYRGSSDT